MLATTLSSGAARRRHREVVPSRELCHQEAHGLSCPSPPDCSLAPAAAWAWEWLSHAFGPASQSMVAKSSGLRCDSPARSRRYSHYLPLPGSYTCLANCNSPVINNYILAQPEGSVVEH